MSNFKKASDEFKNYVFAGIPLIFLHSSEVNRIERLVREVVERESLNAFYYTEAHQLQSLAPQAPSKDVDSDPLPFINDMLKKTRRTVFVLGDTRRLDQDSLYTRELLSLAYLAKETQNTIVVVTAENVWSRLSRFGLQIRLDFPDFDERFEIVQSFVKTHDNMTNFSERDVRQLTTLTRGLSEMQITNMLRSSLAEKGKLNSADIYFIATKKESLFASVSNVVSVSNSLNLEVAGLENLKKWLDQKRDVFFAQQSLLDEYDLRAPKGILLTGVPGCGKSFSAKMIASRWELPLFRFDLGSVYDKYVGETERKMQEALEYIDNVAPCVLWIDEVEKALASSSSESDVGKRILGQFLFWLQESHARVFLVATANDVTKLPAELFRKGRFSETFFVDLPNFEERTEAIKLYSEKSLHRNFNDGELRELSESSEGFSYSDIEQCIKDVAELVMCEKIGVCDIYSDLQRRFVENIPISETNDAVQEIRNWGKKHAVAASLEVQDD